MSTLVLIIADLPHLEIDVRAKNIKQRALAYSAAADKDAAMSLAQKLLQRLEAGPVDGTDGKERDRPGIDTVQSAE